MFEDQPDYEFRRAEPEEAPAIRALVRAAYAKYVVKLGREPKPMTADYEAAVRDHQVWLLRDGGQPIAVLELVPAADHMLIENVAVREDHQHRGIGRKLLLFAEQEAVQQGYGELRLYTNEAMEGSVARYKAMGYRESHREPAGSAAVVHMSKPLAGGTRR